MSIKVGDPAPDFTLVTKTATGPALVKLSEEISKSNVVLLFVPMAFTGVCTTELCDVSNGISAYEALDAKVFGISGDGPFAQEAWAQRDGITLPLLSDYEHTEQFVPEANLIMGGVPKRSAFLIDKQGIVRFVDVKENARELPDFDALKSVLASL
jgi:peroxiredoxin